MECPVSVVVLGRELSMAMSVFHVTEKKGAIKVNDFLPLMILFFVLYF
jgi:hypothetical protein